MDLDALSVQLSACIQSLESGRALVRSSGESTDDLAREFAELGSARHQEILRAVSESTGTSIAGLNRAVDAAREALAMIESVKSGRSPGSAPAVAGSTNHPQASPEPQRARPRAVPDGWTHRTADSDEGVVWQRPGASGNADMVRVMDATKRYPHGYTRFYNSHGQPIGVDGRPGSRAHTHIPIDASGNYPMPHKWNGNGDND